MYQVSPAAIVASSTPNAIQANVWNLVTTKAIQQPSPMMPRAGCMNSSSGCCPGGVVIRVCVIGGTVAPAASASTVACGRPDWTGPDAGTVAGAGASAGSAPGAGRAAGHQQIQASSRGDQPEQQGCDIHGPTLPPDLAPPIRPPEAEDPGRTRVA